MFDVFRQWASGPRRRFVQGDFDLDLTYIGDNLIAMGFPASGLEATFRNHIDDVARMLTEFHAGKFLVFNLTGKSYDSFKFGQRVVSPGFPDHHAPPLWLLFRIVREMARFCDQDPENVVVVHCKAGKGRTGTVIACFLLATIPSELRAAGFNDSACPDEKAEIAMDFFGRKRSTSLEGVQVPSQRRYVHYFAHVLARLADWRTEVPREVVDPTEVRLMAVKFPRGLPWRDLTMQLVTAPAQHIQTKIIFSTAWDGSKAAPNVTPRRDRPKSGTGIPPHSHERDGSNSEVCECGVGHERFRQGSKSADSAMSAAKLLAADQDAGQGITMAVGKRMRGDVLLLGFEAGSSALHSISKPVMRFCFHTSFVPFLDLHSSSQNRVLNTMNGGERGELRLGKTDLDKASNNPRVPNDFEVILVFEKVSAMSCERQHKQPGGVMLRQGSDVPGNVRRDTPSAESEPGGSKVSMQVPLVRAVVPQIAESGISVSAARKDENNVQSTSEEQLRSDVATSTYSETVPGVATIMNKLSHGLLPMNEDRSKSNIIRMGSDSRSAVILTGWLFKEGGFVPSWRKRWFVLNRDGTLRYFSRPQDLNPSQCQTSNLTGGVCRHNNNTTEHCAGGTILLKCFRVGVPNDSAGSPHGARPCLFNLTPHNGGRAYLIQCASCRERDTWVNHIAVIQAQSHHDGDAP